eukprot:scaffold450640_cov86-Attheya_sp.AAC.1
MNTMRRTGGTGEGRGHFNLSYCGRKSVGTCLAVLYPFSLSAMANAIQTVSGMQCEACLYCGSMQHCFEDVVHHYHVGAWGLTSLRGVESGILAAHIVATLHAKYLTGQNHLATAMWWIVSPLLPF